MAATPPPEGMTEEDYDAIHAAVVETVRGRWFLTEYARRNRVEEVQDMLAAIGRLETVVMSQRALPPPEAASPHLRLLTQRADEIVIRLTDIIEELRESSADAYLCDDLETQARAIAGLQKAPAGEPTPAPPQPPRAIATKPAPEAPNEPPKKIPKPAPLPPWTPAAASPPSRAHAPAAEVRPALEAPQEPPKDMAKPAPPPPSLPRAMPLQVPGGDDPRLAALAALDRLSLADKLALFS